MPPPSLPRTRGGRLNSSATAGVTSAWTEGWRAGLTGDAVNLQKSVKTLAGLKVWRGGGRFEPSPPPPQGTRGGRLNSLTAEEVTSARTEGWRAGLTGDAVNLQRSVKTLAALEVGGGGRFEPPPSPPPPAPPALAVDVLAALPRRR